MNPETRQALKSKISQIEDEIALLQPRIEQARKAKENAVNFFQSLTDKADGLREEKKKIKEDLGS
jgi:FtsZ-binding cell division protein ZapB